MQDWNTILSLEKLWSSLEDGMRLEVAPRSAVAALESSGVILAFQAKVSD